MARRSNAVIAVDVVAGGVGALGAPGQNNRRGGGPSRRSMQTSDLPIISDLLKPGQEILVQIAKEPIAKKGARITSHIALRAASWYSCPRSRTSA